MTAPGKDPAGPVANSWRPRMVALDIDGTVVDHDGILPDDVRAAVQRVVERGVPVVLATGRSWHGTQPVFDLLGLRAGPVVCSNGAVTVRYPPLEIIDLITFDPRKVISRVIEYAPQTLIAVEEVGRGYRLTDRFPDGDLSGEMIIEDVDQLMARPVTRVILRDPGASNADFFALAEQVGMHGVSYFIGWSAWLDIAPEGVSKASALAKAAEHLQVDPADVLAVGDGRNDIEMLTWAGRGVAMGDASEDVRDAADAVTGRFAEGGVVSELLRWF